MVNLFFSHSLESHTNRTSHKNILATYAHFVYFGKKFNTVNKSNVIIKYKTKPILLEVESGYSTLGSFFIYALEGRNYTELFERRNKNIHQDDFVHIFLLPFNTETLSKTKLYIFGKYGPAPRHQQVFVEYNFLQDDKELEVDKKKSNRIETTLDAGSKRFFNVFEFEYKK